MIERVHFQPSDDEGTEDRDSFPRCLPRRYQRKRVVSKDIPASAIYVGRPTKWGNPFKVGTTLAPTAEEAVECYRLHISVGEGKHLDLEELTGKDLVCWCPLDQPCHADILLELANDAT